MYSARNEIKKQWFKMLEEGRIPIIEEETGEGLLAVDFWLSDYGVCFAWSFEDSDEFDCGTVKPYFDGCIKKRHDSYHISLAEIDRMGYKLDNVLQLIWENINDGVISAYNLHATEG